MKKRYEYIKSLMIIVVLLTIFQAMMTIVKPGIQNYIICSIAGIGSILMVIFFVIALFEYKKVIFEVDNEDFKIRLVEYDDYMLIRQLLDEHPLENSDEEKERLEEYEKITVDYVRLKFHYLVIKNEEIIGLFNAKKENDIWNITWIKVNDKDREALEQQLKDTSKAHIIFK